MRRIVLNASTQPWNIHVAPSFRSPYASSCRPATPWFSKLAKMCHRCQQKHVFAWMKIGNQFLLEELFRHKGVALVYDILNCCKIQNRFGACAQSMVVSLGISKPCLCGQCFATATMAPTPEGPTPAPAFSLAPFCRHCLSLEPAWPWTWFRHMRLAVANSKHLFTTNMGIAKPWLAKVQ